ncbi:glycosyltransferase sugar-binding region containing DXD domain, partial [Colletotrichum higginsianum]
MLTPRRAVAVAAFLLVVFYLISSSHESPTVAKAPVAASNHDTTDAKKSSSSAQTSTDGDIKPSAPKVATPKQKPMMDMSKMSLYDKLAYQYPYDPETRFPAYIWQTWKWTPADEEFNFREQEASWSEQHPGFVHEVITDKVAVNLLRLLYASVPEVLKAYDALPLAVLKADFFRYLILLARGGIYSDIDTFAIRSALEWIPERIPRESVGLVIGIEADPDRPDWKDWYSRRIQFCQWTIQSKPGHPVLREIVVRITEEALKRKKAG